MGDVIHMGPRTLAASVPLPPSFLAASEVLGLQVPDWARAPKSFTFARRKVEGRWVWEVGLRVGRLWLNLSGGAAPYPTTRAAGREWACDFAERHGFTALESRPYAGHREPAVPIHRVRARNQEKP